MTKPDDADNEELGVPERAKLDGSERGRSHTPASTVTDTLKQVSSELPGQDNTDVPQQDTSTVPGQDLPGAPEVGKTDSNEQVRPDVSVPDKSGPHEPGMLDDPKMKVPSVLPANKKSRSSRRAAQRAKAKARQEDDFPASTEVADVEPVLSFADCAFDFQLVIIIVMALSVNLLMLYYFFNQLCKRAIENSCHFLILFFFL